MNKLELTIHCPVCHMSKINRDLLLNYQGVDHYFCSSQCLKRFQSHPHLYVGDPQHGLSVKQKNQEVLKRRRIRLNEVIGDDVKKVLGESLLALMGIREITFDQQDLFVTYDLLEVSLETIEKNIEDSAASLRGAVLENLKRGLIHYSEECQLDNLAHLSKDGGYHQR
ncbi:MAG: YHS domain-containing protein [Pseudomonadales bacterium]|nr:YHS domain-containing protein [Pseudomonadales bacterium]